ncbi:MAG: polyphosphate polymerase domain-containing protein [Oscillospiraceae bacterium]|nr:polyphosphate polymerase domain-containing protein [Oscillospiraceae bacterium]
MQFRHEYKHEINYADMLTVRQRARAVLRPDESALGGRYIVRSLYFDSISDKALSEKLNGMAKREKFRIRYYNGDTSKINLEKKSKINDLGTKQSCSLTSEEVEKILSGDYSFMAENDKRPLLSELYFKIRSEGLMPKVIVDYEREAFTFPASNVRVTLDYHIRETHDVMGFLNPDCLTVPVITPVILEVKWDNFLPDIVKGVVGLSDRRTTSFSKYSASRIYG